MPNDLFGFDENLLNNATPVKPKTNAVAESDAPKLACNYCKKFSPVATLDGLGNCDELPKWFFLSDRNDKCRLPEIENELNGVAGFKKRSRG